MNRRWPILEYNQWRDTYQTLHRWTQIVGKVRMSKEPWINHSWSSTLYVTPRGLSTGAMRDGDQNFSIEFDFINHELKFQSSRALEEAFSLKSESVASFYERVLGILKGWDIPIHFSPRPNELADETPFNEDLEVRTYIPEQANTAWQVLVAVDNVFRDFRSRFEGKTSPVHFFWGSFDLAVTRFSGRPAPEHPGAIPHLPTRIVREAYSHEVSSCGFWPGNEMYPHAAFYSYTYPEPKGFMDARIRPSEAFYHQVMREFLLPYDVVRKSSDPSKMLFDFLQSTFDAAKDLGHWPEEACRVSPYLLECQSVRN